MPAGTEHHLNQTNQMLSEQIFSLPSSVSKRAGTHLYIPRESWEKLLNDALVTCRQVYLRTTDKYKKAYSTNPIDEDIANFFCKTHDRVYRSLKAYSRNRKNGPIEYNFIENDHAWFECRYRYNEFVYAVKIDLDPIKNARFNSIDLRRYLFLRSIPFSLVLVDSETNEYRVVSLRYDEKGIPVKKIIRPDSFRVNISELIKINTQGRLVQKLSALDQLMKSTQEKVNELPIKSQDEHAKRYQTRKMLFKNITPTEFPDSNTVGIFSWGGDSDD